MGRGCVHPLKCTGLALVLLVQVLGNPAGGTPLPVGLAAVLGSTSVQSFN